MPKFFNKKALIISIIVLPLVILAGVYYFVLQKQKSGVPAGQRGREETLAEKQLKELDELRQKMGVQPLTEKEKQAQIKELGVLRKQSGAKPLSQTEIQRQLEELEKLRQDIY